jgi:membrane-bound metal-dependent hydrolase YbcI (DUF457 family)
MRRLGYTALAIGAFGTGLALAGVATWQLWAFALAPDLSFLAGMGRGGGLQRGQLHPRAVPVYNAAHRLWPPLALGGILAALILLGLLPRASAIAWLAGACAWIAHIGSDRALGFGLRDPQGFQRAG